LQQLKSIALMETGKTDEALKCMEEVLEKMPSDVRASRWLTVLCLRAGMIDRALEVAGKAARQHPYETDVYILLGSAQ